MELTDILAAVCVITGILMLGRIVNVLPSVSACALRWKECMNLENSVKLSSDRNALCIFLILPFCLAVSGYRLYSPDFLEFTEDTVYFACICAVFAGYCLLRVLILLTVKPPKHGEKIFRSARKTTYSFFCLMALLTLACAGICAFAGVSGELSRMIMLYLILAVYLLCIFRKLQILRNCCSFLTSILYLCALEILPSVILVLSAVFL